MTKKMKDSGVDWLGEIPVDWNVVQLGRIGEFSSSGIDKKINADEVPVKIINYVDIYRNKSMILDSNLDYMEVTCNQDKRDRNLVEVGDVIFTPSSETVDEIGMSSVVYETVNNLAFSYHVLRYHPFIELNLSFKKYMMNNHLLYNYFSSRAVGSIRKTLNRQDFKLAPVIIPPYTEQTQIADYLDCNVSMIDSIIEKTKQSIEEYKKYKQSLITEVVTKGLDKNVKMKDSGIEWIGEIPEHWDIVKLKYLFEIRKRISGELGYDVLSVTQKGLKIKDLTSNKGQLSADYSKYQFVYVNDFVMNHMDLLTGWVDLSIFNGVTSPDYRVFSMKDNVNYSREYYKSIFQMCYTNRIFFGMGQGVSNLGRWRLQTDKFINTPLPVPPLEEQVQISEFVIEKLHEIDMFVQKKEVFINELESYKKSLIYEVVTGKKEV